MVLPTPFERLLQDTMQLAQRDAAAAFGRLDEVFGKSASEAEVVQLASVAIQLGAGGLGRWNDTAALLRRMLAHPALVPDGAGARSLWRGLAVVLTGAGDLPGAGEAVARGVTGASEACRLEMMTAQILASRGRIGEAAAHLAKAQAQCASLPGEDPVLGQLVQITQGLIRQAEPQLRQAQALLVAASSAQAAAIARGADWQARHRAWYQHGQIMLLAARPGHALAVVQQMMELEDAHMAGPFERFATASLACRAQGLRGQFKIAAGALEACQDFARRLTDARQAAVVQSALQELEQYLAAMRTTS
jgi:hypothetical protein